MTPATTVSWRTRASSLAALLLLAAGVASCGSGAASRDAAPRPLAAHHAPRMLKQPERMQRDDFALLRTRPEGLPAHTRRLLGAPGGGVNPALAQRIPVLLPGSYWLVPGKGELCVVSEIPGTPGAGTICASTRQVIEQGFATISLRPAGQVLGGTPARLLVGIAPDDAREALVHTHGSITAVPVVRGIFVLRDAKRAPSDFISLRRTSGS